MGSNYTEAFYSTTFDDTVTSSVAKEIVTYWQDEVKSLLYKYGASIVGFAGLVGNILTLVVINSKAYGTSPSNIILSGLSTSDLGYSVCGLFRFWLFGLTDRR